MMRMMLAMLAMLPVAAFAHEVDLTHLPLGDGKISQGPKRGYIWACRVDPDAGGAFRDGPWIHGDGTYDFTAKAVVSGEARWDRQFTITVRGDRRIFDGNDLPAHTTGTFPIPPTDDAFNYDRNPNHIAEQKIVLDLPANPMLAAKPSCVPGAVGILISGVALFNALDAPGRDAVAHETQDKCQGHPQFTGIYHYHNASTCIDDRREADGSSSLIGYAIDGFGIYGRYGEGGKLLTSADLDECHGRVSKIMWDGKPVEMYHYVATWDFPYTVGCLRGAFDFASVRAIGGPPPGPGFRPPPPPKN